MWRLQAQVASSLCFTFGKYMAKRVRNFLLIFVYSRTISRNGQNTSPNLIRWFILMGQTHMHSGGGWVYNCTLKKFPSRSISQWKEIEFTTSWIFQLLKESRLFSDKLLLLTSWGDRLQNWACYWVHCFLSKRWGKNRISLWVLTLKFLKKYYHSPLEVPK